MTKRIFFTLFPLLAMSAASAFGQYKIEPAGAPPAELAGGIRGALAKDGAKVTGNGIACELWLRSVAPNGRASSEPDITLPYIPQGALLGALRVAGKFTDRRGQTIKAGVYTLRYSVTPVNGDHQGVAPQRDFLLMTPAAADTDPNATPNFDQLVAMSRKTTGTAHPAVLSFYKSDAGAKPGLTQSGDTDWVLTAKLGDTMISITVIGTAGS